MYGVRIDLDNTIYNGGDDNTQLWYIYCGPDDTQLEQYTKPRIYVNGVIQTDNAPEEEGDGEHPAADGDETPDADGHFDWYERCNSTTPDALLVVANDTPDETYDKSKMIKIKYILADIPDIQVGEYVIYREGIDSL